MVDYQKALTKYKELSRTPLVTEKKQIEGTEESTLQKVFNVLRTGEFAVGGLLSGVSPIEGIKKKLSPSDALGLTNGLQRLATDIFLDPTTYITLGAGGGAKIATRAGKSVILNKSGTKAFTELSKKIGSTEARKEFANVIIKNPEYIDKSGIKFMGQTIIPKSSFDKLGQTIKESAEKIPVVNRIGQKVEEVIDIFNPKYAALKNPKTASFVDKYNLFIKGIRAKDLEKIENIAEKESKYVQKYGKDFGKHVTFYRENSSYLNKLDDVLARDVKTVGDRITKVYDDIAKNEIRLDILKSTLGETAFKVLPKSIKPIVEKYTDDILNGVFRTVEEFKNSLTKEESKLLKGKYTPQKIFNQISNSKPNVDAYTRHILTKEGRKYLEKEGSFYNALPKPLRVKLKAGETRTLRSTIEEINEQMRDKVGGDLFETDAFKSLAYRQSESTRAIETHKFIEDIKKSYGQLAETGEASRVIDGVKYIRSTNKQLDGVFLPEPIARQVDDTLHFLSGDKATQRFLKTYDNLLNFWKGSVTGWFPAFHTRNFVGGVFNNWLSGMNPKYYQMAVDLQQDLKLGGNKIWIGATGDTYTSKQLMKQIKESGAINQPGMIDVMKEVEDVVGTSKFKKLGNLPKTIMETVENNVRIPLFMDRFLGRGYSVADSAKDVFKYHFDYAPEGLTSFERNWMRRIIPFYTWARNNIPLQIEQMVKQPGKYAAFPKLQQDIGGKIGEEEFQDLPEWMKNMLVVRVGEQGGNALWAQLNLPLEDIAKLPVNATGMRELLSSMSPILKLPLELVTNRNLFWGTDIVNPDLPKEFQTAKTIKQLDLLPEPLKDFLNFKKTKYKTIKDGKVTWEDRYEMDAVKLHILKSTVGRFYSSIGQAFDEDTSFVSKMARLLGGMPVQEIDIDTQRYWNTYNQQKEEKAIKQYETRRKEF